MDLGGNPQALQKRLGWFPFANFLTQYSAIYNLDVATQLVSIEQERLVHLLKRPTSTAITLHAFSDEFAIATAPHNLRAWYVASATKVGFAWGLCKCSNKHGRLTDRLSEAPMVPTKAFSQKSSPEQPRKRLLAQPERWG